MSVDFDIAIIGAGPVGASAAALLARHGGVAPQRIALLDTGIEAGAAPSAAPALRVSALSRSSEQVLRHAGAWAYLDCARLCAYERMQVWHETSPPDGEETLVFSAAELAEPNLGYIAENRAVQGAALEAYRQSGGQRLCGTLSELRFDADAVVFCSEAGQYRARLLIGADGARSRVRDLMGMPLAVHDYHQHALVATVATRRAHALTARQRFLQSGPLALLPLFNGQCSIVWSVAASMADELMACTPQVFSQRLDIASDLVLGPTSLQSERLALPLRRASAGGYVRERAALLGDAAHLIHPLAGQGVNLGLLDAAALCEQVARATATGEDPGALARLRAYEQSRLTHNTLMGLSMSAFNTCFSRPPGPLRWLAARGMGLVGRSAGLRRVLARRALGLDGELPVWARRAA